MKILFAGLAILIAAFMSSVTASSAAVEGGAAASDAGVPSHIECDPEAQVCGQWIFAGKPSHVFTGGRSEPDRVFRLGADHDVAYVGVNTRWGLPASENGGRYGDTGNFLLACSAVAGACELVKASNSKEVTHIIGADGPNLLAEIETYRTDDLNRHDVSYERSIDNGRTWSPVPVPENCNSRRSCRMVRVLGGDYFLLATDTSANSFDEWTTNAYRSNDGGRTWTPQTGEHGMLSTQWSAYVLPSGVDMVLGPRDHQTAIVNVAAGRETVVLNDMPSLHGSVIKLIGDGNALYALVDTGVYPARELRLYAIENNAAKELWRTTTSVGEGWANGQTIVLHTEDRQHLVLPAGVFRSVLQISTDQGKTWRSLALPDELADNIADVVGNRIWIVTPRAIWYQDIE